MNDRLDTSDMSYETKFRCLQNQLNSFEAKFELFMEQLIAQQQEKVLQIARAVKPNLTPDDILNPHDFPELMSHPTFNYEEGLATGMMAAQIGLRAHLFRNIERISKTGKATESV